MAEPEEIKRAATEPISAGSDSGSDNGSSFRQRKPTFNKKVKSKKTSESKGFFSSIIGFFSKKKEPEPIKRPQSSR